jgi:hypothetical protein
VNRIAFKISSFVSGLGAGITKNKKLGGRSPSNHLALSTATVESATTVLSTVTVESVVVAGVSAEPLQATANIAIATIAIIFFMISIFG